MLGPGCTSVSRPDIRRSPQKISSAPYPMIQRSAVAVRDLNPAASRPAEISAARLGDSGEEGGAPPYAGAGPDLVHLPAFYSTIAGWLEKVQPELPSLDCLNDLRKAFINFHPDKQGDD